MTAETIAQQKFLEDYRRIRYAEARGSDKSEYYRVLPSCDPSDPNAAMWAMRSKTYSYFTKNILEPLESNERRPLDVLDLGASNCWLSHRLSLRRHRPVALDIFVDERDGLRASRHYPSPFAVVEADFDHLPLPPHSFDLAIFNASLLFGRLFPNPFRSPAVLAAFRDVRDSRHSDLPAERSRSDAWWKKSTRHS